MRLDTIEACPQKKAEIEKRGYNIKQCAPQPSHTTPISIGIDYILDKKAA